MPPDFDVPQNGGKSQGPHTREAPICPLIRIYADRHLPGGLETMMVLAWLCEDERVRHVAAHWSSLTCAEKQTVEIETLCQEVGVEAKDFIREAAGTAWELGIEFPLRFGLRDVWSYVQQVEYDLASGPTLGALPISLYVLRGVHRNPSRRMSRGEHVQSMEGRSVCDTFATGQAELAPFAGAVCQPVHDQRANSKAVGRSLVQPDT